MRDLQKEVDQGLKEVRTDLEKKLKEALDNPLAGQ
jgi:BMFP domain-containing protein YqiC